MHSLRSGRARNKASEVQTTIEFRKRKRTVHTNKASAQESGEVKDTVLVNTLSPPKRTKNSQETGTMPVTRSSARRNAEGTRRSARRNVPSQPLSPQKPTTPSHVSPKPSTPTRQSPRRSPLKNSTTPVNSPVKSCDRSHDTIPSHVTPSPKNRSCRSTVRRLQYPQAASVYGVKRSLHNSLPSALLCREEQLTCLQEYIQGHLRDKRAGSLYISGAPGTGKTACLSHVLDGSHDLIDPAHIVTVNCMSMKQPQAIYSRIASELLGSKVTKSVPGLQSALVKYITRSKEMILIVLDEVDQLDCRGQEILYTLFEWPALKGSRLLLVGIANALDLTDRVLPRLQSHVRCRPQLLHFPPYTKDQIVTILRSRLGDSGLVDPMAVQFCARKVAAVHGDVRKALDICRRAIERVETQVCCVADKENEATSTDKPIRITLRHVADVISEVYGSTVSVGEQTFPLQQKLVACTLLCMVRGKAKKEATLGKLYDSYVKVCRYRRLRCEGESEFYGLCSMLETRGVVTTRKNKNTRDSKVTLKLEERELEYALQDKLLITSVLEHGVPV